MIFQQVEHSPLVNTQLNKQLEKAFHLDSIKVIHSQNGAPLIFIAQEAESFGFARLFISHQIDVGNLSIPEMHRGGLSFTRRRKKKTEVPTSLARNENVL